jgi:5-methylcytosine-specific restriction endonuclease McrA
MPRTRDQVREAKRRYMAKKRAANPGAAREYERRYHAENRTRILANMREYYGRRFFWGRAMKLRGHGRASAVDLARIWKKQRGTCALSGRRLDRSAQLDHIVAKARGGDDAPSNLRWLCKEANLARRELSDAEFTQLCSDVMAWIGRRIAAVESSSTTSARV